ncbi:hypothetical protein SCHPADRAFT_843534 [Schizopora paradoxa]|uniref:Uncharacterized protein n=1 Tax=Schizopora paradoxa TaxID=27342 RepID=A0A0H2S5R0_9AGAM|nr:hypothetical protein SCHPADRAFT_843534 [Schizopora paradoxa]
MAPPRLIVKGPTLPMTPMSPNSNGAATPTPSRPAQDLKSTSINKHADLILDLIEEQRQLAVAEMHKDVESLRSQLAALHFNASHMSMRYKAQIEDAMRNAQRHQNEATALKIAVDHSRFQETQLREENSALKAQVEKVSRVVGSYMQERVRMDQVGDYTPMSNGELVPKTEEDDSTTAAKGRDQMVQTEALPDYSSSVSAEELRLRELCEQLEREKQTASQEKLREDDAHKEEVVRLHKELEELQRNYEILKERSTSGDSFRENLSNAIRGIKIEEGTKHAHLEKEIGLTLEVDRLKATISDLENENSTVKLELEKVSTGFKEQIRDLETQLEEARTKSRKPRRPPSK